MKEESTGPAHGWHRREQVPAPDTNDIDAEAAEAYSRMHRLLVFGGTFDPVHNGHLQVARQILQLDLTDEVLFVPAQRSPLKKNQEITQGLHRLEMLKLALRGQDGFSYSDIELQRPDAVSYTFDTLSTLKRVYPDCSLSLLIGMDNFRTLSLWHRSQELVRQFPILVFPRPGFQPPPMVSLREHFGDRNARRLMNSILPELELEMQVESSSFIREGIKAGKDMSDMMPLMTWHYIKEHQLYQN